MKIKIISIALALSIGFFTACTDKKKKNENTSEIKKDVKTETKQKTEKNEAEERRLDSIRQVKEHGHAH